jgi:uncharacterized protein
LDLVVGAVDANRITLRVTESTDLAYGAWRNDGLWGLDWDGGHARVGDILELGEDSVVRAFTPVSGQVHAGERVRLDAAVYEGDPLSALGLAFERVTFPSELGPLGAWRLPGASSTWAILVHGKGANREEMLRYLPTFHAADLPTLVIDYRNDEDEPVSASGTYDYGQSEWKDVESAVGYALGEGAEHLILFGQSMGGGIVVNFLYRSDLSDRVSAMVLDAPVLDFGDVIDFGAERRNLPRAITSIGKTVAAWRFGFSWRARDYLRRADELNVPILLFHGDADRLVHVRTSDALARMRPDIVTYVRVPGATHARSWNMDPDGFETALADFLSRVTGSGEMPTD